MILAMGRDAVIEAAPSVAELLVIPLRAVDVITLPRLLPTKSNW
jgi:hypothetical protein